ncbi:hypothetical protein [Streptomyces sp. NPDC027717]|uniref:MmyB family transcriptional regulator n=1 Tax=Streptomyces sp. NPDC027717 TaxID=3155765 RepID=UPI0033CA9111
MASLRQVTARHPPHDQRVADLIGQLTMDCDEFTSLWKRHPVRTCTSGVKHLHHPSTGPLDLTSEALTLTSAAGQRVITCTVEAASAAERALRVLEDLNGPCAE